MTARHAGRSARLALAALLVCALLGAAPALAQEQGRSEARFRVSAPGDDRPTPVHPDAQRLEPEQPASGRSSSGQAGPAQPEIDQSAPASRAGDPNGQSAREPLALPDPRPADDLPLPMRGIEDNSQDLEPGDALPGARAGEAGTDGTTGASEPKRAESGFTGAKPLEIVPIREGKLSEVGSRTAPSGSDAESQPVGSVGPAETGAADGEGKTAETTTKASKAKPAERSKSAKPGKAGQAGNAGRAAKPFWLSQARPEVGLSFKQGAVAFILGADMGRRGSHKTFLLDDPPRRVVDIPGRWRYEGPTRHDVRFDGVRAIRVGEHRDFLRVVFDYARAEARPPLVETTPDGLSVIYFWGE